MIIRDNLIQKIQLLGYPDNEIIVTIEDFFEDNDDFGSIACNIYPNQPSPADFYKKFKETSGNNDVDNIFVRISDLENNQWPVADTVYIVSNLDLHQIKELVKDMAPDEVFEDWMFGKRVNTPEINPEMEVYSIWWD